MASKTPSESLVETRYIVRPGNTNHYGTAFGGVIMSWIDEAAAMVAEKHCGHEAVTVSIDQICFHAPINVGDHVIIKAKANYTGNTSIEIGVNVKKENPFNNEIKTVTTALLTFVGLDENKKPKKIPELIPETNEEKTIYEESKKRAQQRNACR